VLSSLQCRRHCNAGSTRHITRPINLYALIHKQHHRFVTTCSWAAEFAHPVELLVGNVLPVLSGPLILGALGAPAHPTELFIWLVLALTSTCQGHSGLWYPGATRGFHDIHHSFNSGEFGTLTEWDAICGTDVVWRREKAKQACPTFSEMRSRLAC
jgi:sterol desaturase/sphingolipid hydroxylase (fatty acid hydroxylase superfamily)